MSEISELSDDTITKPDPNVITRILIIMAVLLVVAVIASLFYATWQETLGLIIGGALSFVNFYWLRSSLGRMLGLAAAGNAEPTAVWLVKYNVRFMSMLLIVIGVYLTGMVSLLAIFGGLLAMAMAIMIEGFIQLFLAVFRRREF